MWGLVGPYYFYTSSVSTPRTAISIKIGFALSSSFSVAQIQQNSTTAKDSNLFGLASEVLNANFDRSWPKFSLSLLNLWQKSVQLNRWVGCALITGLVCIKF